MDINEPRRTYGMIARDGRLIAMVGTLGDALAAYNAYDCNRLRVSDAALGFTEEIDWPMFVALSRAVIL